MATKQELADELAELGHDVDPDDYTHEELTEMLAAAKDDADDGDTGDDTGADEPRDIEDERAQAREFVMRDSQYVMAEAAKLLNQGEGQEPFKRQD